MYASVLLLLGAIGPAFAQRPPNVSICDYYTMALLKANTPANQKKLLTLVVNTAEIGNYTQPNVGIAVPGILNPGMYKGRPVNLLPFFDGSLLSTNTNGHPSSVNFLDGGGAAALKMSRPAFDKTSNQYGLLTHLYEFFGLLLGCSGVGHMDFPAYGGTPSMYKVHKFMGLDEHQLGYFITQVGLSAASFGVSKSDVAAVGKALIDTFTYKCSPPATVDPAAGPKLQAICVAARCPLSMHPMCELYNYNDGTSPPPAPSPAKPPPAVITTINDHQPQAPTSAVLVTTINDHQPQVPTSAVLVTTINDHQPQVPTTAVLITTINDHQPQAPTSAVLITTISDHQPQVPTYTAPPPPPPPTSTCPAELGSNYQFPHLIVPVSSTNPTTAYGTSFFGEINPTTSTIFDFDFPASYVGLTCQLIFAFPAQSQLVTSSYTFSGSGGISFSQLKAPATTATTWDTAPAVKAPIGTITVAPGNSYTLATYPCPGGIRIGIVASAVGSTSLKYFQDYNQCPIGLYIVAS